MNLTEVCVASVVKFMRAICLEFHRCVTAIYNQTYYILCEKAIKKQRGIKYRTF